MYPFKISLATTAAPWLFYTAMLQTPSYYVESFVPNTIAGSSLIITRHRTHSKLSAIFGPNSLSDNSQQFDNAAYLKRNASRKKFGLEPLSPEDFLALQAEVKAMEQVQSEKRETYKKQNEQSRHEGRSRTLSKSGDKGLFENLFGSSARRSCQSHDDCENPEACCDMLLGKVCCYNGVGSRLEELKPAWVTVPQSYDWNT